MPRFATRMRVLAGLAATAAALVSCNIGVANPAAGLPMVGTYQLLSVDGLPVPAATDSGIFVRGSLVLTANVKFTLSLTDSSAGGTSTFSASGQWTVLGNALTLIASSSSVYQGVLSAGQDSVTLSLSGHTSIYGK